MSEWFGFKVPQTPRSYKYREGSLVEDLIRKTGDAGTRTCDSWIGSPAQAKKNLRVTVVIGSDTIYFFIFIKYEKELIFDLICVYCIMFDTIHAAASTTTKKSSWPRFDVFYLQ